MQLRALVLVALEAHFRLCALGEHSVVPHMDLVAGGTGQVAALMLAAHPVGTLSVLVTAQTGLHTYRHRRRRRTAEIDIYRGTGGRTRGVSNMRQARPVACLTAGGT